MYKNISFQETEFGEKKFLMYRVDDAAQMDHVEVEMLKNNDIKGLLPFSSAQNNDEIKFMYETTNKMKLSQFLGGLVRWEELYPAVQGIVAAIMDCEQYMLNEGHFVLETENIFIDLSSRKIELMFLPVENELLARITWKDFLITLLHNLNYDMKDDICKLETLQGYLTDEKITIKEYAEKIEKIETLGLARNKDVKKENRQSERPVREVKREEKPNVIYNVPDPNSEISSDVMKTEKEEKKIIEYMDHDYIEGLSLLGGEPLEPKNQEGLLPLVKDIKEKFPDKNIWCYTGFDFEKDVMGKMAQKSETTRELLKYIDVIVDGKFEEDKKDLKLQFRGSSNQRILDVKECLKSGKIVKEEQYL